MQQQRAAKQGRVSRQGRGWKGACPLTPMIVRMTEGARLKIRRSRRHVARLLVRVDAWPDDSAAGTMLTAAFGGSTRMPPVVRNDRWHASLLTRRRQPTRRAMPAARSDGRIAMSCRWHAPLARFPGHSAARHAELPDSACRRVRDDRQHHARYPKARLPFSGCEPVCHNDASCP